MNSTVIKERIKNLSLALENAQEKQVQMLVSQEIEFLKSNYVITYARTALTLYRTAFPNIKKMFGITDDEQNKIEKQYKVKIAKQANNQVQIKDYKGMLATAENLLSSNKVIDVAAALLLLTGRRMAEIFCTAKFSHVTGNTVHFVGQLKKRENAAGYDILTLASFDKIQAAMLWLRNEIGVLDTAAANKRFEKTLSQSVYKHFSTHLCDCTAHDLRKAYATIIISLYKPKNRTEQAFISQYLGHSEDDLSTATIYQKYYI